MKKTFLMPLIILISGCATVGFGKLQPPPEFNQKVMLVVSDKVENHQAQLSGYDAGDLQAFHSQQTLPITIEGAFKELFGGVEVVNPTDASIQSGDPNVPAVFEVRLIDIANDIYTESTSYRGQVTLAVAMKTPDGKLIWQKAFRGEGYAQTDPQFGTRLGPQDAVIDAMNDAVDQMQKAIIASPEVLDQMRLSQKNVQSPPQKGTSEY